MESNLDVSNMGVQEVFDEYVKFLEEEQELKEKIRVEVRELEQISRQLSAALQAIHAPNKDEAQIETALASIRGQYVSTVMPKMDSVKRCVPENEYYRFPFFGFAMQRLSFVAALVVYLQEERLISHLELADKWLGLEASAQNGKFHLDLEDYLQGVILMSNELTRFAVNCVTKGNYGRPRRIASFLRDLLSGFRLLNLKNDMLRKKFDSLKYDMKKVEEVVYDLSIRGLVQDDKEEAKDDKEEDKKDEEGNEAASEDAKVAKEGEQKE